MLKEGKLKTALLEAGEELAKVALNQTVKIIEAQAEESKSVMWVSMASGAKTINNAFLQNLADKINPAD